MFLRASKHLQIHTTDTLRVQWGCIWTHYLDGTFTAFLLEVGELHHLGHDEAFLKVSVDLSCSLRSLSSFLSEQSTTQAFRNWCYINTMKSFMINREGSVVQLPIWVRMKEVRIIPLQYQNKCLVSHAWLVKVQFPSGALSDPFVHLILYQVLLTSYKNTCSYTNTLKLNCTKNNLFKPTGFLTQLFQSVKSND